MDKILPRTNSRSLMNFSTLLRPSSSSSSSYAYSFSAKGYSSAASDIAMESHLKVLVGAMLCLLYCAAGVAIAEDSAAGAHSDPSNGAFDRILPHLLNIYGPNATAKDFEIYAPDATFEDPLMRAQGVKQIKSAFYTLPKVFSDSRIVEYSIKENDISPGTKEILMDNKQVYKFWGKDIDMISLIKLQIRDGKITRHEDLWDKKPLKNREMVHVPLVGRFIEAARRGSMLATHALMRFGKDPPASV